MTRPWHTYQCTCEFLNWRQSGRRQRKRYGKIKNFSNGGRVAEARERHGILLNFLNCWQKAEKETLVAGWQRLKKDCQKS